MGCAISSASLPHEFVDVVLTTACDFVYKKGATKANIRSQGQGASIVIASISLPHFDRPRRRPKPRKMKQTSVSRVLSRVLCRLGDALPHCDQPRRPPEPRKMVTARKPPSPQDHQVSHTHSRYDRNNDNRPRETGCHGRGVTFMSFIFSRSEPFGLVTTPVLGSLKLLYV